MRNRYIVAIAVALTAIVTLAFGWYLDEGALSTPALQTSVLLLRIFLVVLIARYVLLLWLGYLHHIENDSEHDYERTIHYPVTIIVPVFNEEEVILPALRSLLALDYPAFDILVVDDGSTDRTYALASTLEGRYGSVNLRVVSRSNGGKAAALNTGIALAATPYVLCMDGDSRLAPGTLRAAMRHFADPRVGAVAGNVKVVNRNNVWTRLQALEYIEGLNLARRAQGFLRVVNIIPGPIGVFRRDVLWSVGGYDNDTFAEDADLTLKIISAGWHVPYEERAIAWTEAPEFFLDLIRQRYRWTRGILQALRKRTALLTSPRGQWAVWISLASMFFEAILWPTINVLGGLLFTVAALTAGITSGVFYWWMLLTMLDVAAALYTVVMEEEDLALVPYAIVYRFMFIIMIDVAKLCATVEEAANVRMTWGKLARAGRI
ncbi:MAG: glycosyltransferase family 2 protein [Gemmatimonadota bacterium]|nr:glycosyltransferase family 2 protein [Gemmatimonadota bacterium]